MKLYICSAWDGKHRLIKWNAYSHEILKPRALRNYIRRNFEYDMYLKYEWPTIVPGPRPVLKNKPRFQEALYQGLMTRLLNKP